MLPILAGPEIGVASTKAFTGQLAVLAARASPPGGRAACSRPTTRKGWCASSQRGAAADARGASARGPDRGARPRPRRVSQHCLYLGRGTSYPIALEGALKLKEISYIHAEGYAAGELKHGPIALIDEEMPVVVIAPYDRVFEKTVSNMQEVAARGGRSS